MRDHSYLMRLHLFRALFYYCVDVRARESENALQRIGDRIIVDTIIKHYVTDRCGGSDFRFNKEFYF